MICGFIHYKVTILIIWISACFVVHFRRCSTNKLTHITMISSPMEPNIYNHWAGVQVRTHAVALAFQCHKFSPGDADTHKCNLRKSRLRLLNSLKSTHWWAAKVCNIYSSHLSGNCVLHISIDLICLSEKLVLANGPLNQPTHPIQLQKCEYSEYIVSWHVPAYLVVESCPLLSYCQLQFQKELTQSDCTLTAVASHQLGLLGAVFLEIWLLNLVAYNFYH
jgi:hypothetical protein